MGCSPSRDMVQMHDYSYDGSGRVAIVTGSTAGIGYHTAKWLAERNVHVILAGRSASKLQQAESDIRRDAKDRDGETKRDVRLTSLELDLTKLSSVERFAQSFLALNLPLNMLINNAGVALEPYSLTEDGFELQFAVNYVSPHFLTKLLLPKLKESTPSRVVWVSSFAYSMANMDLQNSLDSRAFHPKKADYGQWSAYGNSKLGVIFDAQEFHRRYNQGPNDVTFFTLHPGAVRTGISPNSGLAQFLKFVGGRFMKSPEEGAGTSCYVATHPSVSQHSGGYFDKCAVAPLGKVALNNALAAKLWETTEEKLTAWKLKSSAAGASSSSSSDSSVDSTTGLRQTQVQQRK